MSWQLLLADFLISKVAFVLLAILGVVLARFIYLVIKNEWGGRK